MAVSESESKQRTLSANPINPESFLPKTGLANAVLGLLNDQERGALSTVRLLGTVGALLLAFGALGAGAAPVINPVQDIPILRLFTRIPTVSLAIAFAGMGMMVIAWLMLGRFARPGRERLASRAQLNRTLAMWIIPLIAIPPLFSRDVYAYLAQGEIAHRGLDPYSIGPSEALGVGNPLTIGVSNMWRDTSPPYGPLYMKLAGWLAGISGNNIVVGVLLHRGLALIGLALIVWAIPRLARRFGVQPVTAIWLGAVNPLVLFHLVAGAHNDALAIGLMVAGLEIGIRRLPIRFKGDTPPPLAKGELLFIALGASVITLGAGVKFQSLWALGFLGVMIARRWHGRLKDLLLSAIAMAVIGTAVMVLISLGTGMGFGWLDNLSTPGLVHSFISPITELGTLAGLLGMAVGMGNHTDSIVTILGTFGYAVAGLITVKFLWDSFRWRYRPMIGLGVSLGAASLLHIAMQPWYMLWAVIPLAASAGTSRFRVAATAVSVILVFPVFPAGSSYGGRTYVVFQAYPAGIILILIALLLVHRKAPMLLEPMTRLVNQLRRRVSAHTEQQHT